MGTAIPSRGWVSGSRNAPSCLIFQKRTQVQAEEDIGPMQTSPLLVASGKTKIVDDLYCTSSAKATNFISFSMTSFSSMFVTDADRALTVELSDPFSSS